jgi:hypothetical protein
MSVEVNSHHWICSNETDSRDKTTFASNSALECERGSSLYIHFAKPQQGSIGLNSGWNFGKRT